MQCWPMMDSWFFPSATVPVSALVALWEGGGPEWSSTDPFSAIQWCVRSQLRGHVAAVFSAVLLRSSIFRRARCGLIGCLWMDWQTMSVAALSRQRQRHPQVQQFSCIIVGVPWNETQLVGPFLPCWSISPCAFKYGGLVPSKQLVRTIKQLHFWVTFCLCLGQSVGNWCQSLRTIWLKCGHEYIVEGFT